MTAQPLAPVISAVPAGRQRARSAAGRVRGREGEGGLADAARPRQRDQADVSLPQQPGDCGSSSTRSTSGQRGAGSGATGGAAGGLTNRSVSRSARSSAAREAGSSASLKCRSEPRPRPRSPRESRSAAARAALPP